MKKINFDEGKGAETKLIVIVLISAIFIVMGLVIFNFLGVRQNKNELSNPEINPFNNEDNIPSGSFKEESISSGIRYINRRTNVIGNVIGTDYKISAKEDKQKEKGFDSAIASEFLDEKIIISYNKKIKDYPTRIEFKTGFDSESNPTITGNVIGSQESSIKEQSINFFDKYSAVLGVNKNELKEKTRFRAGNSEYISFEQEYKGLPVYLTQTFLVKSNNKFLLYGSNYINNINLDTRPKITEKQAVESAKIYNSITKEPLKTKLLIYPFIDKQGIKNYLAYKIDFPVLFFSNGTVISPSIFVNANNGNIIDISDNIRIETASGRVYGSVVNDHLGNPLETKDFANEYVNSDSYNTITNKNGSYNFEIGNNNVISSELKGPYVIVNNEAQTKANASITIPPYQTDINWSVYDNSYKKEESNVFYHVNRIHDFFAKGDAPFNINGLNYQMAANVELSGTCNAFATGDSINFYKPGGECEALSLSSDVIYHEYTHNVVFILAPRLSDVYYGHTGNMNEGYADYYACSLNNQSCLSDNFLYNYQCLRNCENIKRFPENYADEPHYAAEIISGSFWDIRKTLGQEKTDTLALVALSYDPQTFQELGDDFLIADDAVYGNANLSDGTPNGLTICNGFYSHGILSPYCADILPLFAELNISETIAGQDYLDILGTAAGKEFYNYSLYYNPVETVPEWDKFIYTGNSAVKNNVLYNNFDVSLLNEGYSYIKLVVSDNKGNSFEVKKRIFIDNVHISQPDLILGSIYGLTDSIEFIGNITGKFDNYSIIYANTKDWIWKSDGMILTNDGKIKVIDNVIAVWNTSGIIESGDYQFVISKTKDSKIIQTEQFFGGIRIDKELKRGWPKKIGWFYDPDYWDRRTENNIYLADSKDNLLSIIPTNKNSYLKIYSRKELDSQVTQIHNNEITNNNQDLKILNSGQGGVYYWGGAMEPVVDDVNNDGKKEVFVYMGGNPTKIYGYNFDGSNLQGWPVEVTGVDLPGGNLGSPTIADINNDGYKEIIVNGREYIHVYDYNGYLVKNISLSFVSNPTTETVIYDLNNDGKMEIIRKYSYNGEYTAVLDSDGNILTGWPKLTYDVYDENHFNAYSCSYLGFESTPAIGDIDGDGEKEIIIGSIRNVFDEGLDPENPWDKWHCEGRINAFKLNGSEIKGFPVDINGKLFGSPSVGDINNDGYDEIVIGTSESKLGSGLYVIGKNGSVLNGWPKLINDSILGSVALFDYNNDEFLEISISQNNYFPYVNFIFDYQGNQLGQFIGHNRRSPSVGDINNDNQYEIIVPGINLLEAGKIDGSGVSNFPKRGESFMGESAASLNDMENNGKINIIASTDNWDSRKNTLFVWELGEYKDIEWPMVHHDTQHTGCYDCDKKVRVQSKLVNSKDSALNGTLKLILQKKDANSQWQDIRIITDKQISVPANGLLKLDIGKDNLGNQVFEGFNNLNVVADSAGNYRVYTRFESNGKTSEDNWEFEIQ